MRTLREILACTRGAAAAEFIVALLPLLTTFLCLVQLGYASIAQLVFRHAAIVSVLAAAVIDQPDINPGGNGDARDVVRAAHAALGPWGAKFTDLRLARSSAASERDPYGLMAVTLSAMYRCAVPIGRRIVCTHELRPMSARATFPHQGANYK